MLNEASHGITLRVNDDEEPAKALLAAMNEFEDLAKDNRSLTPEKIKAVERHFVQSSKALLKFEWNRVKRGERIFVWTKRVILTIMALLLGLLFYSWIWFPNHEPLDNRIDAELHLALGANR